MFSGLIGSLATQPEKAKHFLSSLSIGTSNRNRFFVSKNAYVVIGDAVSSTYPLTIKQRGAFGVSLVRADSVNSNITLLQDAYAGGKIQLFDGQNGANVGVNLVGTYSGTVGGYSFFMGFLGLGITSPTANLAIANGTTATAVHLFGTYTDASNYRRLKVSSTDAGVFSIAPEGAGTGATGNVLRISGLPTSNPGAGILWNNAGTPAIGT